MSHTQLATDLELARSSNGEWYVWESEKNTWWVPSKSINFIRENCKNNFSVRHHRSIFSTFIHPLNLLKSGTLIPYIICSFGHPSLPAPNHCPLQRNMQRLPVTWTTITGATDTTFLGVKQIQLHAAIPMWYRNTDLCQENIAGWCSTQYQLLVCSSFSRENGHPLLICSSLSTS